MAKPRWFGMDEDKYVYYDESIMAFRCGKPVGSPPYWMSRDQFDPCPCVLEPGHEGICKCDHTIVR